MALTAHFHYILSGVPAYRQRRHSSSQRKLQAIASADGLPCSSSGAAVVWYKHDLRVDDHPGLVSASSSGRTVVPVYVFDHRIISGLSDEMLDLLLFSLNDLKMLLKEHGSDLLIEFGRSEDAIMNIVNEFKATDVFTEEDLDYNIRTVIDLVKFRLSSELFPWGFSKLMLWKAPLYDIKNMMELPVSYKAFQKLNFPMLNPTISPTLPLLNIGLERGNLPTIDNLRNYLNYESWTCMKNISAHDILQKKHHNVVKKDLNDGPDNVLESSSIVTTVLKTKKNKNLASENCHRVKGGSDAVLNAFSRYLRCLDVAGGADWKGVHDEMRMTERHNGASFGELFGASFYFGTISLRRICYEAMKYNKERNAGFLHRFCCSTPTAAAAVETVCSMELII